MSTEQTLLVGSRVRVKTIGKDGVITALLGAKVRVAIGSLTVTCFATDVVASTKRPMSMSTHRSSMSRSSLARFSGKASSTLEVDLHGLTAHEARRRIDEVISSAVLQGCIEIRFIHGFGSGKIKETVHHRLAEIPAIRSFKLDEQNLGVTRAFLD